MIIDEWNNRQSYATLLKYLTEGIEFADSLMEGPVGKYEAEHGIFALVQEGMTTDLDNNLMECHREYVDVQLVVNGIESIEYADKMSLNLNAPYNKEMDVELFGGSGERKIVTSGQFYILFPQDVHKCCGMVDGTSCRYKKIVLKIPYQIQVLPELNFCNLGNVMDDRLKRSVNDDTTIPMLWQGLK